MTESNQRIEPARIENSSEAISDVMAELSAISAKLENALNPRTATSLAGLVRIMNTYYSNLIEGHDTRPADIEKALAGRGNLSQAALADFVLWFLKICLDQVSFMAGLFELETLAKRFKAYVERSNTLKPEALRLLQEALIRGEFDRGDVPRITGLPERTARRVFGDVLDEGLLASDTPKGAVSLRFPVATQDIIFPRLFAES